MVKNILKWQGGKSDLLYGDIGKKFPKELYDPTQDITFIDAMTGGGSVFLYVLQNCPGVKRILINDYNYKLIELYYTIKTDVTELINLTKLLEDGYSKADNKEEYYYRARDRYNELTSWEYKKRASITLFLNRSGYNGVYRENSKGLYNVPWGKKENVNILFENDLLDTNKLMNKNVEVKFSVGDYSWTERYITKGNTFIYLDPPYRPLKKAITESFTSYCKCPFNDDSQTKLRDFCTYIGNRYNSKFMVSNSYDPDDDFIEKLYKNFSISQITAVRSSGGKNAKRGSILENLIVNYANN